MFQINGEWWKVVLTSTIHPKLFRSDGSLAIGSCDDESKTIYINENLSSMRMKKVLCHAAMFSYNVELNIQQEELLADLIATYGQEIIDITNKIFTRMIE